MSVLVDRYLPRWDVRSVHDLEMEGSAEAAGRAVAHLDLSGSLLVRLLYRLRGMPPSALRLEGLLKMGFRVLGHREDEELVLGLIGRFWELRGAPVRFEPEEFVGFEEPGYAKGTWSFTITPLGPARVRVHTETRVLCTDAGSRRRFLRYWGLIRPFSGFIRKEALRGIRRALAAGTASSSAPGTSPSPGNRNRRDA